LSGRFEIFGVLTVNSVEVSVSRINVSTKGVFNGSNVGVDNLFKSSISRSFEFISLSSKSDILVMSVICLGLSPLFLGFSIFKSEGFLDLVKVLEGEFEVTEFGEFEYEFIEERDFTLMLDSVDIFFGKNYFGAASAILLTSFRKTL